MLNINNNSFLIKREILVRIVKLMLNNNLQDGVHYIPREMAPRGSEPIGCCIYHDREILRQRVIARLGCSLENYDDARPLASYAQEALERKAPTWPMLTVLDEACNACVKTHFLVTNACQACVARPCMMNCARKAITIENHRANINKEKCVNCGLCMTNCPYHAIIRIPVPCEESCPVGAISKDENGKERIDYHKCIFCGNCMRNCPFGAMMDKSQIVDVINHILNGKKVVAMFAPAIATQFKCTAEQLEQGLKLLGFSDVIEVALGADITADLEAKEFEERMARGDKLMTTSCCSAYVRAVHKHVPELDPCISDTKSPMHYTAEIAKKEYPDCVSVFIGPCLAKRREGMDDEFVDYVLSAEELSAFFIAKEVEPSAIKTEASSNKIKATQSGRNFAATGGVAQAVKQRLKDPSILRAAEINGLGKEGMKQLAMYGKINVGKLPYTPDTPNLVEVMSCEGGCVSGPCVVLNQKQSMLQLKKYVEDGEAKKLDDN